MNLKEILLDIIENVQVTIYDQFIAFGAFQLCLIDIFSSLNIIPDFAFGISEGVLISAYFDSHLTLEQTVLCIHSLGKTLEAYSQEYKLKKHIDLKEILPHISECI